MSTPPLRDTGGRRHDVAALYVDRRGVYPGLVIDWYDEHRDARSYAGPHPVVAHPPCGPWGTMRGLSTRQDKSLGPVAVDQVRKWRGVLEHPEGSRLWRACRLPEPGELPDAWGGRSYQVNQVAWGHPCEKSTWLYVVGVPALMVVVGIREGGTATHRVTSGPGCDRLPSAHARLRAATPPLFAAWLVDLAAIAGALHPSVTSIPAP